MDKTETELTSRDSARIMLDIERTRAEMDQTMSEIAARLDPRRRFEGFVEALRSDGVVYVQEITTKWVRQLLNVVSRYPVPIALIGTGITWSLMENPEKRRTEVRYPPRSSPTQEIPMHKQHSRYSAEPNATESLSRPGQRLAEGIKSTAGEVASKSASMMGEAAEQLKGRLQTRLSKLNEKYSRTRQRAAEITEEHPFAVGWAALAIGVVIGLSLSPRVRGAYGERARAFFSGKEHPVEELVNEGFETMQSIAERAR